MAIGVFDSGVGGLTVHRRLVDRFPTADFIYLADQANAPYGGRGGEEIVDLTRAGCERLFEEALPAGTPLIHQPSATADALERYFGRHPEYEIGTSGRRRFLTTGQPGRQSDLVSQFWGAPLTFEPA